VIRFQNNRLSDSGSIDRSNLPAIIHRNAMYRIPLYMGAHGF
jgi:hypothetical protein